MCIALPPFFFTAFAKCSLSLSRGSGSHTIPQKNSIQLLTICPATHHSSARTFTLEMKFFNFISVMFCTVSIQSTGIPSLCGTWYLPPSDIIWTMSACSKCTLRCIQAIGGGQHRCVIPDSFNLCTDKWRQELLESQQPGATIILLIVSTDKTQLTIFGRKQAYPVYLTIGNIPKDVHRKPLQRAQMLIGYIPRPS